MSPTSVRRTATTVLAVVAANAIVLALIAPAAGAQTRSTAFYRTSGDVSLQGSVTCDGDGEGTYVVTTEVAATVVAEGAIDPSGIVELAAGSTTTFEVSGENTLEYVSEDGDVETLFENTGCSGDLEISAASGGSSTVHVRNRLRVGGVQAVDRATWSSRRLIRG